MEPDTPNRIRDLSVCNLITEYSNSFDIISEINQDAARTALKKVMVKFYERYYEDVLVENPQMFFTNPLVVEMIEKQRPNKHKFWLLTVSPDELSAMYSFELFQKQVVKAVSRKIVKHSTVAYEWRTPEGLGAHVHIILELRDLLTQKKAYDLFYNTFKNVAAPQCVDIIPSDTYERFYNYVVKGLKNGEPKENHEADLKLRQQYNLNIRAT